MRGAGLREDCFALPPGIDWTPVDEALARMCGRLKAVTGIEQLPLAMAHGRILAAPAKAARSHPAASNSAVDGYGFAFDQNAGPIQELSLADGRAAAGKLYGFSVQPGKAVRILTGAVLPEGVDTVVLDEDSETEGGRVRFSVPRKRGANARLKGEDIVAGGEVAAAGQRLSARHLASLAAAGVPEVTVRKRLRVGVISTGDELRQAGEPAAVDKVYDANRPMLLALVSRWDCHAADLGCIGDDRKRLRMRLDEAAAEVDAIIASGGASAGDEDHMSALLSEEAQLTFWRIAVKPGRPLAMATWKGTPVFGLPGNPVAAYVCSLIFVRPALQILSGGSWKEPAGFEVPAAFEKNKKAGRREYLRARLDDSGAASVFRSEGSGLTTGLTWSSGLVELEDGARHVRPGDPVRFLPYESFGL